MREFHEYLITQVRQTTVSATSFEDAMTLATEEFNDEFIRSSKLTGQVVKEVAPTRVDIQLL